MGIRDIALVGCCVAFALCSAPTRAEDPPAAPAKAIAADELDRALAAAVDQATPELRRKAALELAGRADVSLDALLAAAARFGTFEKHLAGLVSEKPSLMVDGTTEEIDVHVYVPEGYDGERRCPLLLGFHGSGGDGKDVPRMWQDVADELHMLVVAPTDAGSNEGYRFTHAERSAALAALRFARRRYNVDENRVFVTGISRGGHLTWDLMLRFPDLFAAAAPMIGGPRWNIQNGQNNLRYLENVAALPIRDLQGWQDDAGMLFNLDLAFEKLAAFKAPDAELVKFPSLGHSFELDAVDWKAFWGGRARNPVPQTVVRAAARLDEARAAWLEITAFDKSVAEEFVLKVDARRYGALDDTGKRRFHALAADKKTARLAGTFAGPGLFTLESSGVSKARLLLTREMFVPGGAVEVQWNGKLRKKPAEPSKEVLLLDFVERFDRTFLPVVEISVP